LNDDEKTQVAVARFFEIYLAALARRKRKNAEKEISLVAS
jgi:hypothetical protein